MLVFVRTENPYKHLESERGKIWTSCLESQTNFDLESWGYLCGISNGRPRTPGEGAPPRPGAQPAEA